MQLQVFISYRHSDTEFPLDLLAYLRKTGHKTWIDAENIRAGLDWDEEITQAIRSSDAVLGILTPESIKSKNVLDEWAYALANDIPLILLRAKAVPEKDIPHRYIRIQYIDFTQDPNWAYSRLDERLKSIGEAARNNSVYEKVALPETQGEQEAVKRWHLKKIRTIPYNLTHVESFFIDSLGWLWIADDQQVKRYNLLDRTLKDTNWILPRVQWKTFFSTAEAGSSPGGGAIFATDWEGGLQVFDDRSRGAGRWLRQAQFDDVPVFLLAVGSGAQLDGASAAIAAASWNGEVNFWDVNGKAIFPQSAIKLSHLPTRLLPLDAHHLLVVDETGAILIFDPGGRQVWSGSLSQFPGKVGQIWADIQSTTPLTGRFFVLVAQNTLVRVDLATSRMDSLVFSQPVVAASQVKCADGEAWTCVGLAGGRIEWVSWSQFRTVDADRVELGFEIQDLHAVFDPQNPNSLLAVGLTHEGQFFTLQDSEFHLFSTAAIQKLILDESGRFIYWLLPGKIEIYRNPVIEPYPCRVSLVQIEGQLQVGAYCELKIHLANSGKIPISRIFATLLGEGKIEPGSCEVENHINPGQTIQLVFSARSLVQGTSVPLELQLEMDDEAGPPSTEQKIPCSVKAEK